MDIAIIGGGIGGLAAALKLHAVGFHPVVYEAAAELKPLGVGIAIHPYGIKELAEIGLEGILAATAVEAKDSIYFNRFGQQIYADKIGRPAGYDHSPYLVHRGLLQMILYRAVLERLGPDAVRLGRACIGLEQDDSRVTVLFKSGGQGAVIEPVRADIVVGADGVRSTVRATLFPNLARPHYSGITLWRGVTRAKPYHSGGAILHIGAKRTGTLIVYPILDNVDGSDLTLTNWVIELPGSPEIPEDWSREGDIGQIEHSFDECRLDFLDVPALLRNADVVYQYPMVDHEPLSRWSFGRVTLLGDAAHAMYPRGGNGSNQALVDAGVLAGSLAKIDDPIAALRAYENERLEKANALVIANRGEGPDVLLTIVDERTNGQRFDNIENVLPFTEADGIIKNYHRLAGMARPQND
jgi:2-polyprenyl-6-methoxyphenol hydroxylase-like FAD-dependent oxidoreductase